MITKFKLFKNYDFLIRKIQSVLTPDLLKGIWNKKLIILWFGIVIPQQKHYIGY